MSTYRATLSRLLTIAMLSLLAGCASVPNGVTPVSGFNTDRYLGKWYEIARLNHLFERGLDNVTAQYSRRPDGQIRVINRGRRANGRWAVTEGRASFQGSPDVGSLKVSFFGPFYGGYNIIELDPNYQYALVVGNNRRYMWILSRTPTMNPAIQNRLVQRAASLGYPVNQLIYVNQDQSQ